MRLENVGWRREHDKPGTFTVDLAAALEFVDVTVAEPAKTLAELIRLCRDRPVAERFTAVGSHWSLSRGAVSDHTFLETHDPKNTHTGMDRTLRDVVPGCLHPVVFDRLKAIHPPQFGPTKAENAGLYFVHVEAGKRIYQIYSELDGGDFVDGSLAKKLADDFANGDYAGPWAFRTLGGAGGQTIWGALTTGTHGADFNQGPVAEAVVAIHLVTDGGKHYWIERPQVNEIETVLTDDAKLNALFGASVFGGPDNFRVIRDNDVFNAVLISAGRFGVVYSTVLKVTRQYLLHEQRRLHLWQDVKKDIAKIDLANGHYKSPAGNRFLQIAVCLTPHLFFTRNLCGVTKRWNVPMFPPSADNPLGLPLGRPERSGANAGTTRSYSPDPDKPGQPGQPKRMSFLERACMNANFTAGVIDAVIEEVKVLIDENKVVAGGAVAAVAATAGTAGLLSLLGFLGALLAALLLIKEAIEAGGDSRLGQTMNDVRGAMLEGNTPGEQAAGLFLWHCIAYKLFEMMQVCRDPSDGCRRPDRSCDNESPASGHGPEWHDLDPEKPSSGAATPFASRSVDHSETAVHAGRAADGQSRLMCMTANPTDHGPFAIHEYAVEFRIPYTALGGNAPRSGDVWAFNVLRGRPRGPKWKRFSQRVPTYADFDSPTRFGEPTFK